MPTTPFAYVKDNRVVGYDVDIAARSCQANSYRLEVVSMSFDGILPSVQTDKGFLMDYPAEERAVDEEIRDLHIKVADKHLPILSLSGGNQQKVVIAKGLMTHPTVLLMDEPSRGIEIGAKTEVFEIIHEFSERGLAIIVISSEMKEIMAIADRIYVLSGGKCTAELSGEDITEDNLVRASYAGLGTRKSA